MLFYGIMVAVWGGAGIIYAVKSNLLFSAAAFVVALAMAAKLYGAVKSPDREG
ncbi:hypothetical protein VQ056_02740 [Paenibacillus sp. JTLBN-2024]